MPSSVAEEMAQVLQYVPNLRENRWEEERQKGHGETGSLHM